IRLTPLLGETQDLALAPAVGASEGVDFPKELPRMRRDFIPKKLRNIKEHFPALVTAGTGKQQGDFRLRIGFQHGTGERFDALGGQFVRWMHVENAAFDEPP